MIRPLIQIKVTDIAGQPIHNADIRVRKEGARKALRFEILEDQSHGIYTLLTDKVVPGEYSLEIAAVGYRTLEVGAHFLMEGFSATYALEPREDSGPKVKRFGKRKRAFALQKNTFRLEIHKDDEKAGKDIRNLIAGRDKVRLVTETVTKKGKNAFILETDDQSAGRVRRLKGGRPATGLIVEGNPNTVFPEGSVLLEPIENAHIDDVRRLLADKGLNIIQKFRDGGTMFLVETGKKDGEAMLDLLEELEDSGLFADMEPTWEGEDVDHLFPLDLLRPAQWHLNVMRLPEAWDQGNLLVPPIPYGSADVIVAVHDSGIQETGAGLVRHPEFSGAIAGGNLTALVGNGNKVYFRYDFDPASTPAIMAANNAATISNHGTAVSGLITASQNGQGVVGIAANTRLMSINRETAANANYYSNHFLYIAGFDPGWQPGGLYAAGETFPTLFGQSGNPGPGTAVINCSHSFSAGHNAPFRGSATRWSLIGRNRRGMIIVASSGNSGTNTYLSALWGNEVNVIKVGASTPLHRTQGANDRLEEIHAAFSAFSITLEPNLCVDVVAPSRSAVNRGLTPHLPMGSWGLVTTDFIGGGNAVGTAATSNPTLAASATVAGVTHLRIGAPLLATYPVTTLVVIQDPGNIEHTEIAVVNGTIGGDTIVLDRQLQHNYLAGASVITDPNNDYLANFGGTSGSAPLVSGVIALMLSVNPALTLFEVRDILRITAVPINLRAQDLAVPAVTRRWVDLTGGLPGVNLLLPNGQLDTTPGPNTTAAMALPPGTTQITVVSTVGFSVRQAICIGGESTVNAVPVLVPAPANQLTVANDNDFEIGDVIYIGKQVQTCLVRNAAIGDVFLDVVCADGFAGGGVGVGDVINVAGQQLRITGFAMLPSGGEGQATRMNITYLGPGPAAPGLAAAIPIGTMVNIDPTQKEGPFTVTNKPGANVLDLSGPVTIAHAIGTVVAVENTEYRAILEILPGNVLRVEPLTFDHPLHPAPDNRIHISGGRIASQSFALGFGRVDAREAVNMARTYTHPIDLMIRNFLADDGVNNRNANPVHSSDLWITNDAPTPGGLAYAAEGPHQHPRSDISAPLYTGTGLDDLSVSGAFTGGAPGMYTVEIHSAGAIDQMKWRLDAGAYSAPTNIVAGAMLLSNGVSVTFNATSGHTARDKWYIWVQPVANRNCHLRVFNRGQVGRTSFGRSTGANNIPVCVSRTALCISDGTPTVHYFQSPAGLAAAAALRPNNCEVRTEFNGPAKGFYTIAITATGVGGDTYQSAFNGAALGGAQVIAPNTPYVIGLPPNQLTIRFPLHIGHTIGDRWIIRCHPQANKWINVDHYPDHLNVPGATPGFITANTVGTWLMDNQSFAPLAGQSDRYYDFAWAEIARPPRNGFGVTIPDRPMHLFLLGEVVPHDGPLMGDVPGVNNNISYRELSFTRFVFRDTGGDGDFPAMIGVNHVDTTEQSVKVFAISDVGTFTTEKLQIKVEIRTRLGATNAVTYHYTGGAWAEDPATAEVTFHPPVVTGTVNPATNEQWSVVFNIDFHLVLAIDQVTVKIEQKSSVDDAQLINESAVQTITVSDRGLLIRDHLADNGITVTNVATHPVHSPDIWIRRNDDPLTPPPAFDKDAPHLNPRHDADRYCFVRVKNMATLDAYNAATINYFVALSDGANADGIDTPFLHPDNWQTGTPIANITTDNVGTYFLGSTAIGAADIPLSNATDWGTTDSSAWVYKFTWNQADLPPAGTAHKVYLLAELSPHDGGLMGRGAENNRNLSYREIVFCHSAFEDGTGGALPETIPVDNLGTVVTQNFEIDLVIDIGNVAAEDLKLRVTRLNDNGSEDTFVFEHNGGAWQWTGGSPTWANANAPVVTGSAVVAAGAQTTVTFTGDFSAAMQHNKVILEVLIKSSTTDAIIGREWQEIQILEPGETPIGQNPESAVYSPVSHVFAEMQKLDQPQPAAQTYGPLAGDEANKFRITSTFTANGQTVKAFAITNSIVMLQRTAGTVDQVNLILKPIAQAGIDFTPVRYYIYRGLTLTDFLLSDADPTKIRAKAGASPFITRLYDIHEALNTPGTDLLSIVLGFDPGNQAGGDKIDEAFFEADGEVQLPYVARGMELGEFLTAGSNKFGLDIVLEEGNYQPDFDYARAAEYVIDRTGGGATFADRLAREEILNFVDPAAFYGMHVGGRILDPNGDHTDQAGIYTGVVDKFATKNKLYLDIRNENGNSYNFYDNFNGLAGDPNLGKNLALSPNFGLGLKDTHRQHNWPLYAYDTAFNTAVDVSDLYISLRPDNVLRPVLYIERGDIFSPVNNTRFVNPADITLDGSPVWTRSLGFHYPNTGPAGAKLPIANVMKLHYTRRVDATTVWPATVVPTNDVFDNVFGPLNLVLPPGGATDPNVSWVTMQGRKFVDHGNPANAFVAERGVGYDGFDEGNPNAGRITFYAVADDFLEQNRDVTTTNGITGGVGTEASFFEAANALQGLKAEFHTITDGADNITVFRLVPTAPLHLGVHHDILVLGITRDQYDTLKALAGFADEYPKTIGLTSVPGGLTWRKYKLSVRGLDPAGNYLEVFPGVDIFAYSHDSLVASTKDYGDQEPIPTVYVRNYEEQMGLQSNGLAQNFVITNISTAGTVTVTGTDAADILTKRDTITVLNCPDAANNRTYKVSSVAIAGADTVITTDPAPAVNSAAGEVNYPGKTLEDYCIDKDEAGAIGGNADEMRVIVDNFLAAMQTVTDRLDIEPEIDLFGPAILNRARALAHRNTYEQADDRVLYWARIKMMVALKSHPHLLANHTDRVELVARFDRASRGYDSVNFGAYAGPGKRVLITGFDPFFVNGRIPGHNPLQSNPSGAAALALHGETILDGATQVAFIQSAMLPVRYRDFQQDGGEGIMEDFYRKYIDALDPDYAPVDMIITVSQAGYRFFWIDRFAARARGLSGIDDNEGIQIRTFPTLPAGEPFYETTLPFADIINAGGSAASPAVAGWTVTKADFGLVYNQRMVYHDGTDDHFFLSTILGGTKKIETAPKENDLRKGDVNEMARFEVLRDDGDQTGLAPAELPNMNNVQALNGSGGNYLSNESFYRVARLRADHNPALETGHLHVPKLQGTRKFNSPATENFPVHQRFHKGNTKALIERIYDIIKDATK